MGVKNSSTNEKTLKGMLRQLPTDNYSIDKFIRYCKYTVDDNAFYSVIGYLLDDYRSYFDSRLVEVEVPKKFYYQPAAFAEMYYGTPDLDFLVLYFSKITTLFDFTQPKIKVLPVSELLELSKLSAKFSDKIYNSYVNPPEYIKEDF